MLESSPAAVLLADISGFTPLAERFGRRGPIGAEELSALLNTHFGDLIALVRARGGDVITVAGDALLAVWPAGDDLEMATLRAAECGLAMQRSLHGQRLAEELTLALRIGVACGDVRALHVGGGGGRWHFVVAGAPVAEVAAASVSAAPGQVAIAPDAWSRIRHECLGRAVKDGSALLEAVTAIVTPPRAAPSTVTQEAEPALRAYVAEAVLSRLAVGQREWMAELRRVTTLFAGLPGLDHTGPEILAEAQAAVAAAQDVLHHYDGTLKEFVIDDKGPTLVGVFGLPPRSHEDDPVRAVEAALALRDALRKAGMASAIGIASGRAFCGAVGGAGRREFAIVGEVMNVAARLMQAARDDVLCDDATRGATRERITFESLAPLTVKGKAEPVVVHRPRGRAAERGATRSLFGRADERALLAARLAALRRGEGAVVVIEGEAGIGKSRLVAEFVEQARLAGAMPLVGHGEAIERVTPYHAWRFIFSALFAGQAPHDLVERLDLRWRRLAPLLSSVLPLDLADTDETSHMSGQVRADNTHDLLVHLFDTTTLDAEGRRQPLVLVMEDAHWLDSASWALAYLIAERVRPLLLVFVTRPLADAPAEAHRLLTAPASHRLRLEGIPREALAELVRERLGASHVPDDLVTFVEERAEGNPFYSEELVHALRESGAVRLVAGRCALEPGADLRALPLPATVEGIVASRIDGLAPSEQLALKVASVIGRLFAVRLLRAVYPAESDRDRIARDLQALERGDFTRVATVEPEHAYLFKHVITQEVAYNLLLFGQRRQLHRVVAEWYERVHADDLAARYPLLAHHWRQAEENARAMVYLEKAGEHALQEGAYQEAARFLAEALAVEAGSPVAGEDTTLRRGRLERQLGEAHLGLGQLTESRAAFERAVAALGSPVPGGRVRTVVRLAREIVVQGLHLAWPERFTSPAQRSSRRLVEAAGAHVRLGELCYFANETLPMLYAGLRGLNLADALRPSPELAHASANAAYALNLLRLRRIAGAYLASAHDVAARVAQPSTRSLVLRVLGAHSTGLGAFAEARRVLEQAVEIADRLGDRRRWIECMCLLSTVRHYEGHFAERVQMGAHVLYASARRIGDFQAQAWGLLDQIESLLPLGRLDEAMTHLTALRPFLHANIGRAEEIWAHGLLASAHMRRGELAEAKQAATRGMQSILSVRPTAVYTLEGYAGVAETYLALWRSGDRSAAPAANQACAALHRFAQIFPIGEPRARFLSGVAESLAGRRERARRAWQKSLAASKRLSMPYEQALAYGAIGRVGSADDSCSAEHGANARALLGALGVTDLSA